MYLPKCVSLRCIRLVFIVHVNLVCVLSVNCNCLQVLKHAENSYRPQRSHICNINVQGCLSDGTVVDAHDHLIVQIGDAEVSVVHRNICGYHGAQEHM